MWERAPARERSLLAKRRAKARFDFTFPILHTYIMKSTYSISAAQKQFPMLVRETCDGAVAITRHGDTVAYVVSRERMEALVETMELLADPKAMRAIRAHEDGETTYRPLESLDADR